MGSKKEKKPSIEELARKRITNLYQAKGKELLLICDAAIKGKSLHVFAAFDRSGITLYEYKDSYENKIIELESHRWDEWNEVVVDHYFIQTTMDFKGRDGSWFVSFLSNGREAQQVIESYTDIHMETVSRPWYRKIIGFRSWKTWKMVTATLFYAILLFSIIDMATPEQADTMLANIAIYIAILSLLGLFLGLIHPRVVLPFTSKNNRKRVGKLYGTSFLVAFIMLFIFIPVQEAEENAEPVKSEVSSSESREKEPAKADVSEEENENNEKKDQNEDKSKETDKKSDDENTNKKDKDEEDKEEKVEKEEKKSDPEASPPATSTKTEPKNEEEFKNPAGVELQSAVVKRVVDGDTIEVDIDGKEETVRMILVDTPETKHPQLGVQPFGPEASAFTEESLNGKEVGLEKDVSDRDQYGRLLRYVWVDGELFNQKLIEEGLARVSVYQPDVKYVDEFRASQEKAQQKGIGIWSIENYAQEDGYHIEEEEPEPEPEETTEPQEETETTGDCNIKGNINSSGEKIYHVPGGQFYDVTVPEEIFCSTTEAENAGYRASQR